MIKLQSTRTDMLLTPNHRVICATGRNYKKSQWKIFRADNLPKESHFPIIAKWENQKLIAKNQPHNKYWAELLGWYIAEGHGCKDKLFTVELYQSQASNPVKVERIKYLLDKVGAHYHIAITKKTWRNRPAYLAAFKIYGFAAIYLRQITPNKKTIKNVLTWKNTYLKALLHGLILGDGHTRKIGGRKSFVQNNIHCISMVQAIAFKLGIASSLSRIYNSKTYSLFFNNMKYSSTRGTNGKGIQTNTTILYSGKIWCPQTINTTWVARRNGRIFITGNTFPPDLVSKALLSCASQVCNHCGTPLVRQIKKLKPNLAHQLKSGANKDGTYYGKSTKNHTKYGVQDASAVKARVLAGMYETKTIGWLPQCNCKNIKPVPATIIDPFAGSGTVGQVAFETKRNAILIELNPEYKKLIKQRLESAKIPW